MFNNPFTRREFLQSSLVMVSAVASVPAFLQRSAVAIADPLDAPLTRSRPGVPEDRVLVVIQLSGGNDGLNTVVPYGNDQYYRSRPNLGIAAKQALRLDANKGLGLNPVMTDLHQMFEAGIAATVVGVGYPNPNRSHFASMDIWHTANPPSGKGYGWIGKALDSAGEKANDSPTACVCIGNDVPLATQGKTTRPITFENSNMFRWIGGDIDPRLARAYEQMNRSSALAELPTDPAEAAFVVRTAMNAQVVSDKVRHAVAQPSVTPFQGGNLAQQLKMVASMIRAELDTRVYYVALGGFDTHSNQSFRQDQILREFSSSVSSFYKELKATGHDGRVLTMAFSEFGRRVEENASRGTDHGTAGPMFLVGPMVRPGVLGEYPSLDRSKLDQGDLVHTADFRSVYASILDQWMKIDSTAVLGEKFNNAAVFNATLAKT